VDLLLHHANEIQRVPAYYHSRIISNVDSGAYNQLGSILLGPCLEFWKHVPVNNAGKLLLTYGLTCTYGWRDQADFTDNDLELESGFRYKKPLPGVSLYQLQDIMCQIIRQKGLQACAGLS
jgi:hypothetical protein